MLLRGQTASEQRPLYRRDRRYEGGDLRRPMDREGREASAAAQSRR